MTLVQLLLCQEHEASFSFIMEYGAYFNLTFNESLTLHRFLEKLV